LKVVNRTKAGVRRANASRSYVPHLILFHYENVEVEKKMETGNKS